MQKKILEILTSAEDMFRDSQFPNSLEYHAKRFGKESTPLKSADMI